MGWAGLGALQEEGTKAPGRQLLLLLPRQRPGRGSRVPVHLGREVTNELTVCPQPPAWTSWVLPLGALARQRCLPARFLLLKLIPCIRKQGLETDIQVGLGLSAAACAKAGVGACGRPLASRSEPSASFTLSGHLGVITSKWRRRGEGAPLQSPRNVSTQDGKGGFSMSGSSFQRGPTVESETPVSLSSIIYNDIHVHRAGEEPPPGGQVPLLTGVLPG